VVTAACAHSAIYFVIWFVGVVARRPDQVMSCDGNI